MYKRVLTALAIVCLSAAVFGVDYMVAENSAKTSMAILNSNWQQYAAMQMAKGEKAEIPKDYERACEILVSAKLIEKIPAQPAGYIFELKPKCPKKADEIQFVYRRSGKELEAADSDDVVAEKSADSSIAVLNSMWQQYVAVQMAKDEKVEIPKDYAQACEILVAEKFIDKTPTPPTGYIFELDISRSQKAFEIQFVSRKVVSSTQKKLSKELQAIVDKANDDWQKYCALQRKQGNKIYSPCFETEVYLILGYRQKYFQTLALSKNSPREHIVWMISSEPEQCKLKIIPKNHEFKKMYNEVFRKVLEIPQLRVEELQEAWDKYLNDEANAGRTPDAPSDFHEAFMMLREKGYIEKNFNLPGLPLFMYCFKSPSVSSTGQFGVYVNWKSIQKYKKGNKRSEIKRDIRFLNAVWQQLVVYKMCHGEKIVIPSDESKACEILQAYGFVEKPPKYLGEIKFEKSDKPQNCKFVPVNSGK